MADIDEVVGGYDPLDSELEHVPYEAIAALRDRCPVAALPSGYYFASRHDDVHEALRDGGPVVKVFSHEGKMRALGVVVPEEERLIGEVEGPRHTVLRQLLMSSLHPRLVAGSEPYIADLSAELMDAIMAKGEADLMAEYAVPIPSRVLAYVLGLPEEDYRKFRQWTVDVVNGPYPTQNGGPGGPGLKGAHPEFADYIDQLAEERRQRPRDDLLTRMVNAEVDGERFSVSQIRSSVAHLIMAGNETTANLIANLLYHLLSHPDDYDRVRADRSLLPGAIEESLRVDPPVLLQPRTTVRAVELRGTPVPEGSRVILSLAAANHDPAVFDEPESFQLDRDNAALHCSFGAGAHFCPGAALARMEARVAIDTFLDRVVRAELPAGFERRKHRFFVFNGPQTLPATIVQASGS